MNCRSKQTSRKSYFYATVFILVAAAATCSRNTQNSLAFRLLVAEAKKAPLPSKKASTSSAMAPRDSTSNRRSSEDMNRPRKKAYTSKRKSVIYNDEDEEDDINERENYENDDDEEEEDENTDEEQDYPEEEEEEDDDDENFRPAQKSSSHPKSNGSRRREKLNFEEEEDEEDDDDYFTSTPPRRGSSSGAAAAQAAHHRKGSKPQAAANTRSSRASSKQKYRGGPPPRSHARRGAHNSGGAIVPYAVTNAAGAFTRGIVALKEYMPDPTAVKDSALKAVSAATQTTSSMTKGFYREIKGLTSSELEQVMLKATKADDSPVKGKHVERLVGVTYQISARYDIYDAVLRKLWKKMTEPDWRTKIKSLYILHRFSADGAADHGPALKARLRELRRTRDPKKKEKYFNSKQLLSGDMSQINAKYRTFVPRYAHYVLLRTQCFAGMFTEIAPEEKATPKRPSPKAQQKQKTPPATEQGPSCITATCLRAEHLEAAKLLLKAGCACTPRDGEECENIALASERVAVDLMSLTSAVAVALNRAIKGKEAKDADREMVKLWCQFYSEELLPQTKSMIKKTSPKLDAYGIFLPSRMSASVSKEVLKMGLHGGIADTKVEGAEAETIVESELKEAETAELKGDLKDTTEENEKDEHDDKEADEEPKEETKKKEIEEDEEYEYEEEYYDE